MNLNNLTIKSQEALQQAQQIAQSLGHQQIENEHIFKGLLEVDENVTPFILKKLNVNIDLFKKVLDSTLQSFPKVTGGEIQLSRDASYMLNEAIAIAKKMNDEYVSIEHLILAIFKSKSKVAQILKDQGATEKGLESAIAELRKGERVTSASAEVTSLTTAFSRSSNSPLYFAPAIKAPISKEKTILSFRFSGTSPSTILCAKPSAIAVLPTPGSPTNIGLFLVLRVKICKTLRISSSRPITGSNFPLLANSLRFFAYLFNEL